MKIYVTDGSPAVFFTAVFDAYRENECVITSDTQLQLSLDSEVIRATYDEEKCVRVLKAVEKYDEKAVEDILLALKCCDGLKEQTAFNYIKRLMQAKAPVSKRLSMPEVIEFNDLVYKVTGELHRLKGLLRFMESANGALYAPYCPDNDITELLMPHFAARLKNERFVIHDTRRKLAGLYDGKQWITAHAGEAEIYLSEYERAFENLWKKYYAAVNIKERPHEKQMKRSMPVRYWKFLPEKREN